MNDKELEKIRYDNRAKLSIESGNSGLSNNVPLYLQSPYDFYFTLLKRQGAESRVLEIGAGMGENTELLLDLGFDVVATDFSPKSVKVMNKRFSKLGRFSAQVGDMERLPFNEESFDVVCSAGSLSYGDNAVVMNEIYRVLKLGGVMIAVDSLNNSPIYRFNRYVHFLRGDRSKSTLIRMPSISLIEEYTERFGQAEIKFFGAITWVFPLLSKILSEQAVTKLSNWIDAKFNIKGSAFKFVMMLVKK
jgi:ubiquinone/menaquinone biosynthesis C-methylase UbiE